jgi:hypothetical protein
MTINNYPHETLNQTEISPDLQSQSELEQQHQFIQDKEDITNGTLDDRTIIKRFACGKKRLVVNNNLRIDYAHNSLQLSTPPGELIAIHKIAARLHYILVKKDSKYSKNIQKIITEHQFIPIDAMTAKRGFMRYQKYEIPDGYNLQYSPALELWQTWTENQRQSTGVGLQLDILILARSKWYRVQDMICTEEQLDIQTRLGLISLSLKDGIAWIAKLGDIPAISNADLSISYSGGNSGNDSEILDKIISKLAIESPTENDDRFYPYNTMSESLTSQPQSSLSSDLDDRSNIQSENVVTSTNKEYLQNAAIHVLEKYLEHGETTVITEVVIDPQGNAIGEKTITTQRGCPKWAIDAAFNWE